MNSPTGGEAETPEEVKTELEERAEEVVEEGEFVTFEEHTEQRE